MPSPISSRRRAGSLALRLVRDCGDKGALRAVGQSVSRRVR
jgi:hypothetical protein